MWRNSSEAAKSAGGLVVVAVDSGKNSHQALKWASDNLIAKGRIFHILHVRRKPTTLPTPTGQQLSLAEVNEDVASTYLNQLDIQTKELFLPFQCFCSRRGLCCKEIIVDHTEVSSAIIDYIIDQPVDNLVLGASSRNAFARAFKQADVPTTVSKLAPDFCSIYVVAKGKLASVKPALRANKVTVDQSSLVTSKATVNPFQTVKSDPVAQQSNELQTSPSASPTGVFGQGQSPHAGFVDLSCQSVNSCPSPTSDSTQSFDHPINEVSDGGSQLTKTNSALDRNSYLDEYSIPVCPEEDLYEEFRRLKLIMKLRRENIVDPAHAALKEDLYEEFRRLKLIMKLRRENIVDPAHAALKARDFYAWTAGEHKGEKLGGALEGEHDPIVKSGVDVVTDKNVKFLNAVPSNVKFRRYTVEEIKKATDNFSDLLKIGEGGYGPVFLSNIDHSLVAIKVLRCNAQHGMKQFQQEVEVLSEIRHPNMVILMGACPEIGCLVYEYMSNGSLEDRLACQNYTHPLSWELRFKIAAEIATGLLFLHKRRPEPLVHRDLKPANILLDQNFVCKISDVGLARLIPPAAVDAVTQYRMTAAAGTFCYIDPEYQKTGLVSIKSDVYALGIILLQLITATPPMGLAHNMERAIKLGKFREMLDPSVQDWPMEETLEFGKLALKCAELHHKDRPDLATVVLPELNHLKELAEERQCNVWKLQHANTFYHQDVSFSSGSSSTSISD